MIKERNAFSDLPIIVLAVVVILLIIAAIIFVAPNIKIEPTHVKCPKCGWEGNKNETKSDTKIVPVYSYDGHHNRVRYTHHTDYLCPKCGSEVKTVKGEWPPVNETTPNSFYLIA